MTDAWHFALLCFPSVFIIVDPPGAIPVFLAMTAQDPRAVQVDMARRARDKGRPLTNLVMMGMGEPFHNYDNVMKMVAILHDPMGMGFGARRITISTSGVVPFIDKLATEPWQVNLAVSIHAGDDELRAVFRQAGQALGRQGDVARTWLYFSTRWGKDIYPEVENVLRSWHVADPPDSRERTRNDRVALQQGNRNVFVDCPQIVGRIADFHAFTPVDPQAR